MQSINVKKLQRCLHELRKYKQTKKMKKKRDRVAEALVHELRVKYLFLYWRNLVELGCKVKKFEQVTDFLRQRIALTKLRKFKIFVTENERVISFNRRPHLAI
jgi:hypothetical protein